MHTVSRFALTSNIPPNACRICKASPYYLSTELTQRRENFIIQVVRNIVLAAIALAILVALLTAGFFIGLAFLGFGVIFWGYLKLRRAGIIGSLKPQTESHQDYKEEEVTIIETDYEVMNDKSEKK